MIDLRSDTVTQPTDAMRRAMAQAKVGDDVYGEDPTVNRLQELAADMLGMEAALYVPSGTQGNLIALLSHCARGDEYIVGQNAHTYKYEGGGAAVLGGIQPQPLPFQADGSLDLNDVERAIKPDDPHFAVTRLVCLENTHHGKIVPLSYLENYARFCRDHDLGRHLDGARLFNAVAGLGCSARDIAQHFDTVSICLSKGLGAPVGSILCGTKIRIYTARRWRKVTGGGMRQAGVIAAAGIVALENHVERLAEDHDNAARLAERLAGLEKITVTARPQTNMVFIDVADVERAELIAYLKQRGILIANGNPVRLVTHLDVSRDNIDTVIDAFKSWSRQT